jgi:hypothetical protein
LHQNTSPYSSSTLGQPNDIILSCGGNGSEQAFSYLLQPSWRIRIWQSWNNYDSRHELRYGGSYPGDTVVSCIDDPDTAQMEYKNIEASAIPVYFIVDAYSTGSGDFTLEWVVEVFFCVSNLFLLAVYSINFVWIHPSSVNIS